MNIIGIAGVARSGKSTVAKMITEIDPGFVEVALADPIKRAAMDIFDFSEEQLWGNKKEEGDVRYRRELPTHDVKRDGEVYVCKNCHQFWKPYELCSGPCRFLLTPRHVLQQLGTEMGRACYEDVWIEYLMRVVEKLLTAPEEKWITTAYTRTQGFLTSCIADGGSWAGVMGQQTPNGIVIPDVRFANEARAIVAAGGVIWQCCRDAAGIAGSHSSETQRIPPELITVTINNNESLEFLRGTIEVLLHEHSVR